MNVNQPRQSARRELLVAAALLLLSAGLLFKCWRAPFLSYDDISHVYRNEQVIHGSVLEAFPPRAHSTYYPLTILSYKLDRVLFDEPGRLKSPRWAHGIRLMNALYHAAAAFALFHLLRTLGLPSGRAFFIAAVFAAHPLACESVCWAAERKNILAGLFGFAALWSFARFRSMRGLALAVVLYAAALCSKPSALGLLPVFAALELFLQRGWIVAPGASRSQPLGASVLRLLPMIALCAIDAALNLKGLGETIVPPPGGSVWTAMLTDADIFLRYLMSILAPADLSIAYYVEPITSLADARLWTRGLGLLAIIAATAALARDRRRAALGWLWFFGALGPHLNLVAHSLLMQDRYLYLAMPGALLALVEAAAGALERLKLNPRLAPVLSSVVLLALWLLAIERSALFGNALFLFQDAANKQPLSAHAKYGLMQAWAQIHEFRERSGRATESEIAEAARQRGECALAALRCPDIDRQVQYSRIALEAGTYRWKAGDAAAGEQLLIQAIRGLPKLSKDADSILGALTTLAELRLEQKRNTEALADIRMAALLSETDTRVNLARGRAALAVATASTDAAERAALRQEARASLSRIPAGSERFAPARQLMQEHGLDTNAPR